MSVGLWEIFSQVVLQLGKGKCAVTEGGSNDQPKLVLVVEVQPTKRQVCVVRDKTSGKARLLSLLYYPFQVPTCTIGTGDPQIQLRKWRRLVNSSREKRGNGSTGAGEDSCFIWEVKLQEKRHFLSFEESQANWQISVQAGGWQAQLTEIHNFFIRSRKCLTKLLSQHLYNLMGDKRSRRLFDSLWLSKTTGIKDWFDGCQIG